MTDEALELRDVRGPSALGGSPRRALELLYLIAVTEFKRTYFGTALGYLWSLCRPLLLFAVLLAVFTHIVKLGNQVPHYPVLLLLNIVLFGFFQEATTTAVGSVLTQESIVRKTQFPRLVIPLAVVLTSVFNLVFNLAVVVVFLLAFGITPRWTWLGMILVLGLLFVLTTAVSMILSALYPRFRDIGIIWAVFAMALLYGSPVLYPLQHATGTLNRVLACNPLAPLFELTRRWVIQPNAPIQHSAFDLVVPIAISAAICGLAVWVFNREAPRIAEAL
ncbi:MAG TPA: ABC transporter permease [Solirubrobacteraceae bacterium]|nr:ABC transporter permease [Solirubrobacteraceae bacterium]